MDVIGDEQDNAVSEEAVALGRRMVEREVAQTELASWGPRKINGPLANSPHSRPWGPRTGADQSLGTLSDHTCPPLCWTPYQQCQHLEHGDLRVAQVGEEVNEGRDAEPVAEAGANGCAHQGALPLWGEGSIRGPWSQSSPGPPPSGAASIHHVSVGSFQLISVTRPQSPLSCLR